MIKLGSCFVRLVAVTSALVACTCLRPVPALAVGDPDAGYCPATSVSGSVNYSPFVVGPTPSANAFSMTVGCNATGAGDEQGTYSLTLNGTTPADTCAGAAGTGSGTISGTGPEGAIAGTFTFTRPAIHYYILGSYTSGGESHTLHLWLDITNPKLNGLTPPDGVCPYDSASLIGHGAFVDNPPTGAETANCQYQGTATIAAPGVGWQANTGTYGFSDFTFTCAFTDPNDSAETSVSTISLSSGGSFNNSVCGTGTADGTATVTNDGGNSEFTGATTGYHLQFVGGQGVLSGSGKDADGTFTALGSTSIIATGGGNTPNSTYCTESFQVVGDATLTGTDTSTTG